MEPLVLVVDDDNESAAFLDEAMGYWVVTAVDGKALPIARDERSAVILLDIHMPGMDGIEVSRRLRADPVIAHIPIVVMSTIERSRARSGEMAINDHLPKPCTLDKLYSTLERWAPIGG